MARLFALSAFSLSEICVWIAVCCVQTLHSVHCTHFDHASRNRPRGYKRTAEFFNISINCALCDLLCHFLLFCCRSFALTLRNVNNASSRKHPKIYLFGRISKCSAVNRLRLIIVARHSSSHDELQTVKHGIECETWRWKGTFRSFDINIVIIVIHSHQTKVSTRRASNFLLCNYSRRRHGARQIEEDEIRVLWP